MTNYSLFPNKTNGCTVMVSLQHVSPSFWQCIKQLESLVQSPIPFKLPSLRLVTALWSQTHGLFIFLICSYKSFYYHSQIRDAYMLKIFENNMTRLPNWCSNGDDQLPFCQILGEYKMELPYYNTLEPYTNMNENCPSLPPSYERPVRC